MYFYAVGLCTEAHILGDCTSGRCKKEKITRGSGSLLQHLCPRAGKVCRVGNGHWGWTSR